MAALQAFQPPLGPQPNGPLYAPQQVTIVMKEKVFSLTGDSFHVKTIDGADLLIVKGTFHARREYGAVTDRCSHEAKKLSIHQKKVFTDLQGNELFTLGTKTLALFKSFEGESPAGHNFSVKGQFSVGSSKSTITFVNAADKCPIELRLKGDWFDRSANITLNDRPVASITRSFGNAREIFGSKQTVSNP